MFNHSQSMPENAGKDLKNTAKATISSLVLITLLNTYAIAQAPNVEQQRQTFRKAWQAVGSLRWETARQHSASLKDYPLLPYLRAEQMRIRPGSFNSDEISTYLETYANWGFASNLRTAWSRHLGDSGQYRRLLEVADSHSAINNTGDAQVQCHLARARIAQVKKGQLNFAEKNQLLTQVSDLWRVGKSQHKNCDPAFDWLRSENAITSELAWQRVRLAMQADNVNLARYLERFLNSNDRPWLQRWLTMANNRNSGLQQAVNWPNEARSWEIANWGLNKLSRANTEQAWQRFQKLDAVYQWPTEVRNLGLHEIAVFSALSLELSALGIIDQLPVEAQDQQVLEWRTRVALANSEWNQVLASIGRMTSTMQVDNRWKYWRARALQALGQVEPAQALWQSLATEPTYYGFLAADYLGQDYNICPANLPAQYLINDLPRPAQMERALELYKLELIPQATREWRLATADLSHEQNLVASRLAADAGWLIQSIFTLTSEQARQHYDLRFPLAYEQLVREQASKRQLDPALIYGLMRAESAMNPRAVSPANARGLMQVTPGTARRLAAQHGRVYRGSASLLQPEINVPFGSLMLQETLTRFNQNMVDVLGAYNAGPHVVDRWHQQVRPDATDIWIETLPYFETRDYIPRVLAFSVIYDWQLNAKVTPISRHMPGLFSADSPFKKGANERAISCQDNIQVNASVTP